MAAFLRACGIVFALFAANSAFAQQQLGDAEITQLITGKALVYEKEGLVSRFHAGGHYSFERAGATSVGKWEVKGDRICIDMDDGRKRCDEVFKEWPGYYIRNERGSRYSFEVAPIDSLSMVPAQQQISGERLRDLLAGKTGAFTDGNVAEYHPDGRYIVKVPGGRSEGGKWIAAGDRLCIDFDSGRSRCDRVYSDAQGYYIVNDRGTKFRVSYTAIGSTTPTAGTTRTICDQAVTYSFFAPATQVPEHVRLFAGLWLGTLEWVNCRALIVEAVQPIGSATVIYMAGAWQSFKASQARLAATITGNKLSWRGGNIAFEYIMTSPDQLRMTRFGGSDIVRAQLNRGRP